MDAILICFGLLPFLAGQTTLTVGLAVAAALLPLFGPMQSLVIAVIALSAQVGVLKLRGVLASVADSSQRTLLRVDRVLVPALAMSMLACAMVAGLRHEPIVRLDPRLLWVLAVGAAAFGFVKLRHWLSRVSDVVPLLGEGKVQTVIFVTEVACIVVGMAVLTFYPRAGFAIMVLTLCATIGLGLGLQSLQSKEQAACAGCGVSLHRGASRCPSCALTRAPSALGVFGRVLNREPASLATHRLTLLTARRCPSCAESLVNDFGRVSCKGCRAAPLGDPAEVRAFVAYVDTRAVALAPIIIGLGFVPVLGLGAAMVLYRVSPAGAMAPYGRMQEKLGSRVVKWFGLLALTLLQPVPLIGVGATAAVIGATHVWSRRAFAPWIERAQPELVVSAS